MAPAQLHSVFKHHLKRVGGDPTAVDKKGKLLYPCVTMTAGNVFKQWREAVEPVLGKIPSLGTKAATGTTREADDGTPASAKIQVLCIMDEAHKLSARIAGILNKIHYSRTDEKKLEAAEKDAYKLYRHICWDNRIQVLALSGTPIQNHPFNIVPLFNMLRREFGSGDQRRALAFPERYERFYEVFMKGTIPRFGEEEEDALSIKAVTLPIPGKGNRRTTTSIPENSSIAERVISQEELFNARIKGLCVWYEAPKGLASVPFPVIEEDVVVPVEMSNYQWKIYQKMESEEQKIEEVMKKFREEREEGKPVMDSPSVFRSLTRQASNFAFPEGLYAAERRNAKVMLQKTDDSAFKEDIGKHSCKIKYFLDRLEEREDIIVGLYSYFVEGAGIAIVAKALRLRGWIDIADAIKKGVSNFSEANLYIRSVKGAPPLPKGKKRRYYYAIMTGGTSEKVRLTTAKILNDPFNAREHTLRCILYSGAASHGLTFKSGEELYFLESQWEANDYKQATDRWVRINSAEYLPPNRRKLRVYRLIAVPPKTRTGYQRPTADAKVLAIALRKYATVERFIDWIKDSSANCSGQYMAENSLHSELIKKKVIPPYRVFFSCTICKVKYHRSFPIQHISEKQCTHMKPHGKKLIKFKVKDVEYQLDPSTGIGWVVLPNKVRAIVRQSQLLRSLWKYALKK